MVNVIGRYQKLLPLILMLLLVASCSKDDDTATAGDYCYIKSVTLGNVQRQVGDLTTTFSGSYFPMTINLREGIIENRDSLPCGSQLSAVIATITFEGAVLNYRTKYSEAEWKAYSSTDSLDLTKPLELSLTSGDSKSSRLYTFKVNVHKQEGDSLHWKRCEEIAPECITGLTDTKALIFKDKLTVLGKREANLVLAQRSGLDTRGAWEEASLSGLPADADPQTLCKHDSKLYISTPAGQILYSDDAKTWQQTGTTYTAGLTLLEKTAGFFYALSEGKLLRSADASTWEEDDLDSDASLLPSADIKMLSVKQANGSDRIVMVGCKDGTPNGIVWNKTWNDGWQTYEKDAKWIYFQVSPDNIVPCPKLQYFNLLPYDGKCIAFGGASADGQHEALDVMYVSRDYGLTWRPSDIVRMPSQIRGVSGSIAGTVDKNNFIWIITNAQVWRGRLNRLGFAQQ